jgi:hypothetical protein
LIKGLRVLLVGSVVLFVVSALSMLGFAIATSVGKPTASGKAMASAQRSETIRMTAGTSVISGAEVCGLLSADQVVPLLNDQGPTGPGTPQPIVHGGGCAWGTGRGETFELTVEARGPGLAAESCSAVSAVPVHGDGWAGCSRLQFGPGDNAMTAFGSRYRVSIQPEVDVIGYPYVMAEEATIGRVFQELTSQALRVGGPADSTK